MEIKEIRKLKDDDLIKQLEESHRELFNLRFQVATGQLTDKSGFRKVQKTISRIKTIIRERQLAQGQE